MKERAISLSPEYFQQLFPFHIAFDRDLTVTHLGSVLARVCPEVQLGDRFPEHFQIQRPAIKLSFESIQEAVHSLFIVRNSVSGLVLRGQMLYMEDLDSMLLLSNPWVSGAGNLRSFGLSVDDFPLGDPIVDLLQVIQLQENTVRDLSTLNDVLAKQKEALRQANSQLTEQFKSLEHAQALTRSILETAPDAIITIGEDGVIDIANPAAEALFGYGEGELLNLNVSVLMPAPDSSAHSGYIARFLETGESRILGRGREVTGVRKNREQFPLYLSVGKASISGRRFFTGILHDMTLVKETEAALIAAREAAEAATLAKSQFLANMSHEIRTPMNAVIGMTTVLLDTQLSQEQQSMVETIQSSGDAMLGVINDILDFSKIESGAYELQEQEFNLAETIEIVLSLVASKAASKNIEIAFRLSPDIPLRVTGDQTRLRQVLLNLLNNAVKFTEEGEIILSVESIERSEQWLDLHFSVSDTGIGISEIHLDRLFQSFTQVDSSPARRFDGTGLGLAISRALVGIMGGKIWAESVEGKGSVFHFTVRLGYVGSELAEERWEGLPKKELMPALVYSSGQEAHTILLENLKRWGVEPHSAGNLQELAGVVYDHKRYPVWLIDTDLEAHWTEFLPGVGPALLPPNVILLCSLNESSRSAAETITDRVKRSSVVHRISKPYNPSQLFQCLNLTSLQPDSAIPTTTRERRTEQILARDFPLSILVVEDNPVNQQVARLLLRRLGYDAEIAASGQEAIEATSRSQYDVIFLDLQMPGMDGLETCTRLRSMRGSSAPPWIIAMTADVTQGTEERCLEVGMNGYVSKPVRPERLKEALLRVIESPPEAAQPPAVAKPEVSRMFEPSEFLCSLNDDQEYDTIRDLLDAFIQDTEVRLANLEEALEAFDLDTLRRTAHAIKGASAQLGAEAMASSCLRLEKVSDISKQEGHQYVSEIKGTYAATIQAIRDYTASLP